MTPRPSYTCSRCGMSLWHPVADLEVSTLGLYDDARYPGRCLLVVHEHFDDLATMPEELANAALADARRAALAIKDAVAADRINYAVLGNVISHVHFHLIPRRWTLDPAPGLSPWQTAQPATPLLPDQREAIKDEIASLLISHDRQTTRR
ncbi:HIT domain-containing protein [Blastococcus sp. MG754426]|uniref:HIT family protein n=1 Tax=unclassified Blastococcus TaxID=2619396 RepID=UPI001EF08492|nr:MULTISPECIES: HIT domain-containing protein [unclassified Blastococcus]MCF6506859.1 HIT domain-containing protein [Blastococcus sp. MG754426]MCF6511659.1 HIT domain-containing protein [Blastococcus sp. MG754427]